MFLVSVIEGHSTVGIGPATRYSKKCWLCLGNAPPTDTRLISFTLVSVGGRHDVYLDATKPFKRFESLFGISEGPPRGLSASKSAISKAYRSKDSPLPFRVTTRATRGVGASWAVQRQTFTSQVATWASVHTKFYQIHTMLMPAWVINLSKQQWVRCSRMAASFHYLFTPSGSAFGCPTLLCPPIAILEIGFLYLP